MIIRQDSWPYTYGITVWLYAEMFWMMNTDDNTSIVTFEGQSLTDQLVLSALADLVSHLCAPSKQQASRAPRSFQSSQNSLVASIQPLWYATEEKPVQPMKTDALTKQNVHLSLGRILLRMQQARLPSQKALTSTPPCPRQALSDRPQGLAILPCLHPAARLGKKRGSRCNSQEKQQQDWQQ